MPVVESSFAVVAEPNRRAILSLLLSSERSVGELEREAQRRLYRLRPEPLMELDAWLVPFRRFWTKHVDALEQHLDKMDRMDKVPSKRKKHERS
jgi:hypothetical protein